jgi:uncharacterized protein (DUF2336 family)
MAAEARHLMEELDATLSTASEQRHLSILRQVTDLFFSQIDSFSESHVALFDDIIDRLIPKAAAPALAELSSRLTATGKVPAKATARLAAHDNITVAGPLLQSPALDDETLAAVAGSKGPDHLARIAMRPQLAPVVTDAIVPRASADVARGLAANPGASFSEIGFVKLINRAKEDKDLGRVLQRRTDIPPELEPFLKLALT